jgi:ACS family glucarate transporter-like MFS transporter
LQNCVANLAGVAAPAITGFAVERTGRFFWAFAICSAVVLAGAAGYAFLLGPVEPLEWAGQEGKN